MYFHGYYAHADWAQQEFETLKGELSELRRTVQLQAKECRFWECVYGYYLCAGGSCRCRSGVVGFGVYPFGFPFGPIAQDLEDQRARSKEQELQAERQHNVIHQQKELLNTLQVGL